VAGVWGVFLFQMKILFYNVRGLGGFEKKSEVKRQVNDKKPFVLCIQESKMSVINDSLIKAIWGCSTVGYSFQPSIGASGGMLTIWDSNFVEVWSTTSFPHVLVIRGRFLKLLRSLLLLMCMRHVIRRRNKFYGISCCSLW
jgi:hypothetical protein